MHPVAQDLPCVGCGERFVRVAALIFHLETGQCPKISAAQYRRHLQHKHNVSQLLKDPNGVTAALANIKDAAHDTETSGGVALIDDPDDHSASNGMQAPLKPEKAKYYDKGAKLPEMFPPMPSTKKQDRGLVKGMKGLSVNSPKKEEIVILDWEAKLKKNVNLDRNPNKEDRVKTKAENGSTPAWSGDPASESLFPAAKPTPPSKDYLAALEEKQANEKSAASAFSRSYMDPDHRDWNPEHFQNPITEKYKCPIPGCPKEEIPTEYDLANHFRYAHVVTEFPCPICMKRFGTTYGLVAHFEAPNSKCGAARMKKYGELLDGVTGGFVAAKTELRDDVEFNVRIERDDGTGENRIVRPAYVKYEATAPPELEGVQADKDKIVIGTDLEKVKWEPKQYGNYSFK